MHVLVKFPHGLGDAVQLSCVLQHLKKYRPDWMVDVATLIGKQTAFAGLCRRSLVMGCDDIDESTYRQVFELGWYECYSVYSDSPCTKVCNCLREVFGIVPDLALLKYRIEISDQAREITRWYLARICGTAFSREAQPSAILPAGEGPPLGTPREFTPIQLENDDRFPVVAVHYEGNTSADKKNLPHEVVAELCRDILQHGYVPLILDWDRRSPLPDQKSIFCPGVGPGDLWDNTGTGDAERLAALLSQCALVIGVDSGPLHVAGATQTPTLGVWRGHSPLQFFDLCPNVTHIVPEQWRSIPPCQYGHAAQFFSEHYSFRTYPEPDGLKLTLIEATLGVLAAGPDFPPLGNGGHGESPCLPVSSRIVSPAVHRTLPSVVFPAGGERGVPSAHRIRAPPQHDPTGNGGASKIGSPSWIASPFQHDQGSLLKETLMTTATALDWQQIPGLAHEVALGADGSAWCLGMGEMPSGGYSIHCWNGADWDHVEGAAAKIAAGPDGSLWLVDRQHHVLRRSPAGWELLPGLAREIAVGADGSAWCLSASDFAPGGASIHVWNGQDWSHVDGAAVKIAVGPDGQPWIVNSAGNVFRRSGEGWELLPGLAREIAIGADGTVWCLSAGATSADASIHVWNGHDWDHVPGAAVKIAAGSAASVLIVNAEHQIFRAAG